MKTASSIKAIISGDRFLLECIPEVLRGNYLISTQSYYVSTLLLFRAVGFIVIFLGCSGLADAQNFGDYRSRQSGNWNATGSSGTWEQYDGTNWVTQTPSVGFPIVAGVATSRKTTVGNEQHTIVLPGGIQNGDLIIIFWADGDNSSTEPVLPGGYTQLASSNANTASIYRKIWYRVADGTEGTSVSTTNSFGDRSAHITYRFAAGSYTGTPFVSAADNGTDNSPNPPSLNPGIGIQKYLWLAATLTAEVQSCTIPANFCNDYLIGTSGTSTSSSQAQVITVERLLEIAQLDVGPFALSGPATHTAFSVALQGQVLYTPIGYPLSAYPIVAGINQSNPNDNVTSHIVSMPAGVEAGDLLVVIMGFRGGRTYTTGTVQFPSGWTALVPNTASSDGQGVVYYKIATVTEAGAASIKVYASPAGGARSAHTVYRIQKGSFSGLPEVTYINATSLVSGTNPNPPALTPSWGSAKNLWIVGAAGTRAGTAPNTSTFVPANFSNGTYEFDASNTTTSSASVSTAVRNYEGSTLDPGTFTLSITSHRAFTIAIKGASQATIRNTHTVTATANQTAGGVTVESGGTLLVNDGIHLDISADAELDIQSGGILKMPGTSYIGGAGDFTLNSGASMEIGSASGIASSGTSGNIQNTGTIRSFNTGANYTYNGTVAQVTGSGLLQNTPANVTFDNPISVTSAANAFTTSGNVSVLQGILDLQATDANYTIAGNLSVSSGATLKHSQDWSSGKQLIVNGNLGIDGTYDYSSVPRAHIGMYGTGTKTISAPNTALSILTLQNGSFSAIGNLTVNDNFWAMFASTGSFSTSGNTVTANAALHVRGGQVNIDGGTLTVTGGFNVGYQTHSGACVLSSGTLNVDQLNLGTGAVTGTFTHSGGVANISAGISIASGSSYYCTGSPVINLAGNLVNDGTFTRSSSLVTLDGSASQTIGGTVVTDFYNLTVNNNGAGVTLAQNVTVNNILVLNNGIVTTGSNTLIVNSNATTSITGGAVASYINGNLRRGIAAGANTYFWPVGTTTAYTPVSLAFTTGTVAGFLNGSVADGDEANIAGSTFDAGKTVNRNWSFTVNSGLTTANYDATFNWVSGDQDPTFDYATAYVGKYSGSAWSYPTVGTRTASSIQMTGGSGFSSFQIGNNVGCTPPTFTTGPGNTDVSCFGGSDGAIILTITSASNAPYTFSVDNGVSYTAVFSGTYPNITLTGLAASTYKIRIKDSSGCESVACP